MLVLVNLFSSSTKVRKVRKHEGSGFRNFNGGLDAERKERAIPQRKYSIKGRYF